MTATYDDARSELRQAELDLMLQRERVAEMRRTLPPGPISNDYTFAGADGSVTLSELVGPERPLIVYHFMFGGRQQDACPMWSMWTDGWNAVIDHVSRRADLVLVTQASVEETQQLVAARGWGNLRWLSAAGTTFKADYGSADGDGNQMPFFTVFERDGDDVRLSWSGGAHIDGDHWRGVDLLSPVWNFFDLTRAGRGDWMPA